MRKPFMRFARLHKVFSRETLFIVPPKRSSWLKVRLTHTYRPTLTPMLVLQLFVLIGLIQGVLGMAILLTNIRSNSFTVRYDTICALGSQCTIPVHLPPMSKPTIYYVIDTFYQNHKDYADSVSPDQLSGRNVSCSRLNSECYPLRGCDGGVCPHTPCGLRFATRFNDTISVQVNGTEMPIDASHVAWDTDLKKYSPSFLKDEPEAERRRTIAWMRVGPFSRLPKPYGQLTDTISGPASLVVDNHYPVHMGQAKYVTIRSGSTTGSKALGWSMVLGGLVCWTAAMAVRWAIEHAAPMVVA
ncbi:CDC50/LEM3 family [Carpediemonas membranifera]|uniref:CDC50/LEM3 family n=1 Tax=Carpediemonas membranifera TaxID=201153 RepID=A0A8J6AZW6_9EUKA|nr:CDC50/LEM3 family [Carpediemonas membranifera]|eukprot:KAG9395430.1 CDC50/LEM3 family [Carpediemonas membranifera]